MSDLRGYTLAQFRAATRAAARSDRRKARDLAIHLRAAQYDPKAWKRYFAALDRSL